MSADETDVIWRIKVLVAELIDRAAEDIDDESVLVPTNDGRPALLDSLDGLKLGLVILEEYGLEVPPPENGYAIHTVGDLARFVSKNRAEAQS